MTAFLICAVLSLSTPTQAEDPASQEALQGTQQLLTDKKQRNKAVASDKKAKEVDQFVKMLSEGNEQVSEEIYSLAAEVFSKLAKDANNDPEKMNKALEAFSKDPSRFAAEWTPEQRKKLHLLSDALKKKAH